MTVRMARALLIGTAALGSIGTIDPQTAAAQQVAQATSGLEEIVVTARRREENIQSVPVAITALSTEELRERHVAIMDDLGKAVPAFNVRQVTRGPSAGPGTQQNNIRGLPGVSGYFAEAPAPVSGQSNFFDLQNVQVLTGPQGTLFGINATGGAILIEPKRPVDKLEAYVDGTLGRFNLRVIEGALNVPVIADKVLIRVAARREMRDGIVTRLDTGGKIDDTNTWGWRAAMTVKPTEDIENYVVYQGSWTSQHQAGYILEGFNPASTQILLGAANINAAIARQRELGVRTVAGLNVNDNLMQHRHMVVDIFSWQISDEMRVKNIASYRTQRGTFRYDPDGTPLRMYTTGSPESQAAVNHPWDRVWSEELQLQGSGSLNGRFDWTIGGFVNYSRNRDHSSLNPGTCQYVFGFVNCPGPSRSDPQNRTQALFGQGTYDLGGLSPGLDGLKFTAGLRYNWDMRSTWSQSYTANGVTCSNVLADRNCVQQLHGDWKALSYTFALDYQLNPDTLLFVTTRKGFSSGDFNAAVPIPERQKVNPEFNQDIEIGVKADWRIGNVEGRTNLSLFNEWYRNVQRSSALTFTDAGGVVRTTPLLSNAAKSRIRGFDGQFQIRPTDWLELRGNVEYLDAKFVRYINNAGLDLSNRRFGEAPKWQFNVGFRYHVPVDPALGRLTFTWNTQHKDKNYFEDQFGTPFEALPGHYVTDIRLDWHDAVGAPIDIGLYVKNLFDREYRSGNYSAYGASALGFQSNVYADPRTYGVQFRYRFE